MLLARPEKLQVVLIGSRSRNPLAPRILDSGPVGLALGVLETTLCPESVLHSLVRLLLLLLGVSLSLGACESVELHWSGGVVGAIQTFVDLLCFLLVF